MNQRRPHVVIFNPDSWRGDVLGHLGNPGAVTPHLDALVRDGAVSYASAFAQNPVCTPSRCSFMTGRYVHTQGHRSMKHMLREHEPHLLKVLMGQGYRVWWGGKNDLAAVKTREDFLKHCHVKHDAGPGQATYTHRGVDAQDHRYNAFYRGVTQGQSGGWPFADADGRHVRGAVKFIEQHSADSGPMCLFLPLSAPHPAYVVEKEFHDLIDPALLPGRLPIPENEWALQAQLRQMYDSSKLSDEDWRELRRVYYAMCTKVDAMFGQVVAALKAKGIYDDTLIVFLSDHGDFTGDYDLVEKTHCTLQDNLLRVPLIIKPPAEVDCQAGVRRALVELVDLCPTVYDLLGIEPGYATQGRSLRQSLAGDDSPMRQCVFAQVGARRDETAFLNNDAQSLAPESFYGRQGRCSRPWHLRGSYAMSARSTQWKLIRRPYLKHDELYDLRHDPGELHNLAGRPEHEQIERQLNLAMLDHFLTTADVLPFDQDSRRV